MLLAGQVIVRDDEAPFVIKKGALICTLDIQYDNKRAYVAADICSYKYGELGRYGLILPVEQDYIPGFFAFREGPLLLQMIKQLIEVEGLHPRLLVIDGHGVAHPRKMGLASWVGVQVDIPTIGMGKDSLLKFTGELDEEGGSTLPIFWEDEIRGYALRTVTGIKPVFVSAGHNMSHKESLVIIQSFVGKYRIIDPMRRADMAARKMARERSEDDKIDYLYTLS